MPTSIVCVCVCVCLCLHVCVFACKYNKKKFAQKLIFFSDKWARTDYELQRLQHTSDSVKSLVLSYTTSLENTGKNRSLNRATFSHPCITHLDKLGQTDTTLSEKISSMRRKPFKEESVIWDNLNLDRFMFDCIPAVLKTIDPDARPLNIPKT